MSKESKSSSNIFSLLFTGYVGPLNDFCCSSDSSGNRDISFQRNKTYNKKLMESIPLSCHSSIQQKLSLQVINDLRSTFKKIDTNRNGKISQHELKQFFKSKNMNLTYKEIDYLVEFADIDGDGQIDFYEFLTAFSNQHSQINENKLRKKLPFQTLKELKKTFNQIDNNGNGLISPLELKQFLHSKNVFLDIKEINYIMQIADRNGDGQIDFYEFVDTFTSNQHQEQEVPFASHYKIQQKLSPQVIHDLRQTFKQIDYDRSGKISPYELKQFFKNNKINLKNNEIDYMIEIADIDGDGQIDFYEFVTAFANQYPQINEKYLRNKFRPQSITELKRAFNQIDQNGNGTISPLELKKFLESKNIYLNVKEINYIMQISDLNGDGQIDFYEFVKAFSDKFSSETKSPKQNQFSNIKKKLTPKILKQLKRSFMEIDTNHDRVISPSELKTFLQSQNINLSYAEINYIVSQADLNHDGHIDFYEFVNAFSN